MMRQGGNGSLGTIIAALVGFLALLVSAYTAYIQREQTRAQVWPRLLVGNRPADRLVVIYDKGIGPAIIRSVQVLVDGKPQPDWHHVTAAIGLKLSAPLSYSTINSVVISPGEELHLLKFATDADYAQVQASSKQVEMHICYCSVLNDCWMMNDQEKSPARRVLEVDSCPVDPALDFTE